MTGLLTKVLVPLGRLNDAIEKLGWWAGTVLIAAMTVSVLLQVWFRYVLGDSLNWTAEASRFMMVWMALIMAPITLRRGANVGIGLITANLRGRARMVLDIAIMVALIATLAQFVDVGLDMVERGQGVKSTAMRIPMAYFYVIVPVSFSAMILVAVEIIVSAVRGLFDPSTYRSITGSAEEEDLLRGGDEDKSGDDKSGDDNSGADDGGAR